jgi:hypothetical protein
MPKKKSISSTEKVVSPEQFHLVLISGIKVYPVSFYNESKKKTTRHIQVDNNGQITTYEKEVSPNDLNDAVAKTIIY